MVVGGDIKGTGCTLSPDFSRSQHPGSLPDPWQQAHLLQGLAKIPASCCWAQIYPSSPWVRSPEDHVRFCQFLDSMTSPAAGAH